MIREKIAKNIFENEAYTSIRYRYKSFNKINIAFIRYSKN